MMACCGVRNIKDRVEGMRVRLDIRILWIAGGICLAGSGSACAAEPATDGIAFAPALKLAEAALDDCQARGYPASASVVDAKGVVRVTLRGDGAIKPPVAAPIKAFTAFTFNQAGSDMQAREQTDAAFRAQIAAHSDIYNDHAGSLPLRHGDALIGGLAVADVPHEIADACARAALAKYPQ
jgi:uncharacterized protein GlcG (DUF336 family)